MPSTFYSALKKMILVALLLFSLFFYQCSSPKDIIVCINHVNVVTMEKDEILVNQMVVVKNGIIETIVPSGTMSSPENAQYVDAEGKYMLPAFSDMHVHLFSSEDLNTYVNAGVTTIMEMSSGSQELEWKEKIKQGELVGPTIYTSAMTLDGDPPLNWMFWSVNDSMQVKKIVESIKLSGYDFIKTYGTLSPSVFKQLSVESKRLAIPLVGHIPREIGVEETLKSGFAMMAHIEDIIASYFMNTGLNDIDQKKINELASLIAKYSAAVTSTIHIPIVRIGQIENLDSVLNAASATYLSPAAFTQWMITNNRQRDMMGNKDFIIEQRKLYQIALKLVYALQQKSVVIISGTDASTDAIPGVGLYDELRDLVKAGLTPFQSLSYATSNAGRFVNLHYPNEKFGMIKKGYRADILLMKDNPLNDIENAFKFDGVLIRGVFRTNKEIEISRQATAKENVLIKTKLLRIDSLFEKDASQGLKELKSLQTEYPGRTLYSQWVLGGKVQKWKANNLNYALQIAVLNSNIYKNHFSVHNELGMVYFDKGQYDSAGLCFSRALKLAPYNAVSITFLDKLEAMKKSFNQDIAGNYRFILQNRNNGGFPQHDSVNVLIYNKEGQYYSQIENRTTKLIGGGNIFWLEINGFFGMAHLKLAKKGDGLSGSWKQQFGFGGTVTGRKIQ